VFPYWLLFSLFAVGAIQYRTDGSRSVQGGLGLLAMGFLTALMIGLRYEVGGDWPRYVEILKDARYLTFWEGLELQDPGYGLVNWIVAQAGLGIWAVNLVCSLIFTWGLIRFARRQPNPWLVLVVAVPYLIIVVAMGYTRQAVAVGIILAGLAVLDRGLLRFFLYMVAAVAFHKSALVILPLVALSASNRRIVTVGILLGSAVLLYYLFVQASVDKLMTNYVESGYASSGAGIRVALNIPPAVIFLTFSRRFITSSQEKKLWRNFAVASLAAAVLLLFTSSTTAVDRLALYLIPLQMFVLGRMPAAFPQEGQSDRKLAIFVIIYAAAVQFVWLNYADNVNAWLPFRLVPFSDSSYQSGGA
jgi:hypothetical protein